MDQSNHPPQEVSRLRLLAAALELQHLTSTASNVVPIPGTERNIVIGTPAEVVELLPELRTAVPAAWLNFARSIADLPAGAEPNLDGMRAKARQLLTREEQRQPDTDATHRCSKCRISFGGSICPWCSGAGYVRGALGSPADAADAVRLAKEALEAAQRNHGLRLTSYPPQDAWVVNRVDEKIRVALAAINGALSSGKEHDK